MEVVCISVTIYPVRLYTSKASPHSPIMTGRAATMRPPLGYDTFYALVFTLPMWLCYVNTSNQY